MACPLCAEKNGDELCIECKLLMLATEMLHQACATGQIQNDEVARNFVRELGFTFNRDSRTRRYFVVANELIFRSVRDYPNEPIPLVQLQELRERNQIEVDDIMAVLQESHIARRVGSDVFLEDIGMQLAQMLPTGIDTDSEIFKAPAEEMRGAICIVLGRRLIEGYLDDGRYQRPRNYLLNMKRVCRHTVGFLRPEIDREIPVHTGDNEFFRGYAVIRNERQRIKILWDMLDNHLLIAAVSKDPGGGFTITWKESVPPFLERLRERWRERERGRTA